MSRLTEMARFDGNVTEPSVLAECTECGGDISTGDVITRFDNDDITHEHCEAAYVYSAYVSYRGIINE